MENEYYCAVYESTVSDVKTTIKFKRYEDFREYLWEKDDFVNVEFSVGMPEKEPSWNKYKHITDQFKRLPDLTAMSSLQVLNYFTWEYNRVTCNKVKVVGQVQGKLVCINPPKDTEEFQGVLKKYLPIGVEVIFMEPISASIFK